MDPTRKRHIRLVMALSAAVLLSVALIYTSFSAANEAVEPSELLAGGTSGSVDMTGVVVDGSVKEGQPLHFEVVDRDGTGEAVPVTYTGEVPDPFRAGREVIVTGELNEAGTFVAQKDSLITKCPSKFAAEYDNDPQTQPAD
jgi:cytochrome c-type biogenesis protein CcmE